MKRFLQKRFLWTLTTLAVVMTLTLPWVVFADQVVNDIDTTIDPALETVTIAEGGSAGVGFYIQPSNTIPPGDASGCNATGSNPAWVNLSVPPGVTASATSLRMVGCENVHTVTFSSSTAGSYNISVASVTGGKPGSLWDTAPAAFTLIVTSPPSVDTTPPDIVPTISPAPNANGWNNTNVTVSWSVNDPESGIASSSGCGTTTLTTETAGTTLTCSAINGVGLSNSASVTIQVDKTAPTVSASASPGPNAYGWNNTNVTVSFSGTDALSDIEGCSASVTLSSEGAGQSAAGSCTDKAGNIAWATASGINIDKTAPTISGAALPAANAAGWNNTDVTVSFTCVDNLSGVASCGPGETLSSEGAGQSVTGTAVDNAGNTASATVSGINMDKTPPDVSVTGVEDGATYILGSVPVAGCETTDALSGVATYASLSLSGGNANGVGDFTATCSGAEDVADNSAPPVNVTYRVIYNWNGFFRPVDNLPTFNVAKAGSAIPVKFCLNGDWGLSIFAPGYPQSMKITCETGVPSDSIEETVTAGQSSLSYDSFADQYVYVWKTDKAWASTCRQLVVMLNDGMEYRANFKFNK